MVGHELGEKARAYSRHFNPSIHPSIVHRPPSINPYIDHRYLRTHVLTYEPVVVANGPSESVETVPRYLVTRQTQHHQTGRKHQVHLGRVTWHRSRGEREWSWEDKRGCSLGREKVCSLCRLRR